MESGHIPSPRPRRFVIGILTLMLAGCSGGRGDGRIDDDEAMVRSVLTLMVARNGPVCTDRVTDGDTLSVFREMARAPRSSRADLRWFPPTGLKVPTGEPTPPAVRDRSDALPPMVQQTLNGAATRMARPWGDIRRRLTLTEDALPAGVTARWWVINRLRLCTPRFGVRDPVRYGDIGFVVVEANHHGALYALQRRQGRWTPVAEWSNWLY